MTPLGQCRSPGPAPATTQHALNAPEGFWKLLLYSTFALACSGTVCAVLVLPHFRTVLSDALMHTVLTHNCVLTCSLHYTGCTHCAQANCRFRYRLPYCVLPIYHSTAIKSGPILLHANLVTFLVPPWEVLIISNGGSSAPSDGSGKRKHPLLPPLLGWEFWTSAHISSYTEVFLASRSNCVAS